MKWTKVDAYHIVSGAFIVAKAWARNAWLYIATRARERLGVFDTAAEAKSACVDAAKGRGP